MLFGCRGECALLLLDRNSDAGFRTIHSSHVPKQSPAAALSGSGAGWLYRADLDRGLWSQPWPPPLCHLQPGSQAALVASPRTWTLPQWQLHAGWPMYPASWSQSGYLLLVPGQIRAKSFRLSLCLSLHHPSPSSPVIHLVLHSRRDSLI